MTDPQTPQQPKAKNQWLAQQDSIARLHRLLQAGGMQISKLPHPLQPGSAVITIPFPKGSSEATEK
jgi:hypothetical protein